MVKFRDLLNLIVERDASDLHLIVGVPPQLRIDETLIPADLDSLSPSMCKEIIYSILSEEQKKRFELKHELDLSFEIPGLSRFRINVYHHRGYVSAAIRRIPLKIFSFDELGLPAVTREIVRKPKGLVLVTGATGSGKSTSLASMIDSINQERHCHIVTVEDPIEYVHQHRKSVVSQREIGSDTYSFANALKYVLRQDPDVILIGEMRDLETVRAAMTIAETGHLVFTTLHTNDAVQTINRIIDIFPSQFQAQIRVQLSFVIQAVFSQQLIPKIGGKGRVLACEVMIATPAIRSLIREAKAHQVYSAVQTGLKEGMQTMNMSLIDLYSRNLISYENVWRTTAPEDLERLLSSVKTGKR
ncbi:MAG: type IV pilus twitching motility protein PilT [Candidatus Ratteibacteria bacterium]|nr:type IV pilus twitching motility protein PilT [Candidatus Ratteibacteria bacterium]